MLTPSIFGENLFDDWMEDFPFEKDFEKAMYPAKKALYGKHAKNLMKTDVRETDDAYEIDIDLPGFKKDEITAQLKDGCIVISAAKGLDKDTKEKKNGKYIRKERYAGSMSRSFYVGEDIT
ncbi:Hsp20/alpha crystallin family protein, partial [Jutongia sp.]|uniref:Hsp20/alpha crystallin family protein n=1 Tax=Jutongia sp. TaxID=2944204 RepID=UPI00307A5AA4